MRWILALVALLLASTGELAAQNKGKGIRLWNLTTVDDLRFSAIAGREGRLGT